MPPPAPPPPGRPSESAPPGKAAGTVGSNVDQPAVWQRAQLSSNSSWPSCTFLRRRCPVARPGERGLVGLDGVGVGGERDAREPWAFTEFRRVDLHLLVDLVTRGRELGVR